MKLVFIRHAIAVDREKYLKKRKDDSKRPLTAKGRRLFSEELRTIRSVAGRVDTIVASPFLRTQDTAKLLGKIYPKARQVRLDALAPAQSPRASLAWLKRQKRGSVFAVVGHEPGLGRLIGFLSTGKIASNVVLKKGALCILEFSDKIIAGKAEILCLMQPQILRSLKE